MKIKLRYPIRRGKSGFKSCISHYAFVAEQLVKDHEKEIDENNLNKLDDYIVSLKLMEIYNKFEARLTEEQKDAINYFRYHNPDESKPINYEEVRNIISEEREKFFKAIKENLQPVS